MVYKRSLIENQEHLRLRSDLNVGVGPVCGEGGNPPGRPVTGLFVTSLRGFGGGKNVGGRGGASELVELSFGCIGRVQSLDLL